MGNSTGKKNTFSVEEAGGGGTGGGGAGAGAGGEVARKEESHQVKGQKKTMTSTDEEAFRLAFKKFDKNGDGTINKKELGVVMKALGLKPTQEELDDMIASVDDDGSGSIQWDEFVTLMTEKRRSADPPRVCSRAEVEEAFSAMDQDGNGYITRDELKEVMASLDQHYTDEEVDIMIADVDKDGDGRVNISEFQGMVSQ